MARRVPWALLPPSRPVDDRASRDVAPQLPGGQLAPAWTGFDIILLGCLSTTAWALWKQRQIAIPAAMITSALLMSDAWFDILTARPGRCMIVSIATAVFAELPIAALLGLTAIRLLLLNMGLGGPDTPDRNRQSLWRAPLPASEVRVTPTFVAPIAWARFDQCGPPIRSREHQQYRVETPVRRSRTIVDHANSDGATEREGC